MRLVVGVSGGSGIPYAHGILQALASLDVETHLVVSSGAKRVMSMEGGPQLADLSALAHTVHDDRELGAAVASGSYRTAGMLVAPCSAGTLAKIAHGFADTLLSRAAHVTLKERRPLVLVTREDPMPRPMLTNMLAAHDAGATLMSASPGFYHAPNSVQELLHFVTVRVLDQFGLDVPGFVRWGEQG
ncbi:UbiX family flavin prenyltransferase [Deinococcus sp.]|uniref:UbiX family flavin prenyltransferase n=1 Tax=Deinococcus sp. TaxID=47478 RepID=UPI0025CDFABD|nr:UbiX family flavin prenyltransferase [Deinococcus sp.]